MQPAPSEAAAIAAVDALRREFHDARHHAWAYRLTPTGLERSSDDGEPSGSAGKPILAQLEGSALHESVVVVVRWFGGTKLGVGGLVRAYGDAAREVLLRAAREHVVITRRIVFEHPYEVSSAVEQLLAQRGLRPSSEDYGPSVRLVFDVRVDRATAFAAELVDRTKGRGRIVADES